LCLPFSDSFFSMLPMITTTESNSATQPIKVTWFEAPSMRLSGMTHSGGIVKLSEFEDRVELLMSQEVRGYGGTMWKDETRVHTIAEWNILKPIMMKLWVPQKK